MGNESLYSREERIDFILLKERVARTASKRSDTHLPDSLGDQLVRMSLKMSLAIGRNEPGRAELITEANNLLKQADLGCEPASK